MHSQLPASEASPESLYRYIMTRFLAGLTLLDPGDPDATAVYPNARAQRIWTTQRAKRAVG
jgi:hypothetical protein